jgi:hypothetical protein
MSKFALIQTIGGLTCLLCQLLHSRRFSDHFVEPDLYCISVILPFRLLSIQRWAAVKPDELGQDINLNKTSRAINKSGGLRINILTRGAVTKFEKFKF